ncbi:MAG: hypothetical protein II088_08445 [Bacteroidales bacterium]|nr:hypothetical protein [Bacteroidales bacterium]MBQ2573638.1 hypothetical protein [Bacteroidales bacterium]
MADQRLEEYRAYYDARTERYANNPLMKHSYEAEKKLRDLFYRYDNLDEIGQNLGRLNTDCAFATWRDQYEMESEYYESVQEPIRKKGADQILAELDRQSELLDMMNKVNDLTNKNSVEITADEANGKALMENWKQLDKIDIYTKAVVPAKYKPYMQKIVDDEKESIIKSRESVEKTIGDWVEGWRMKPEITLEYRYRHIMPYSDQEIDEHLKKFKNIINR